MPISVTGTYRPRKGARCLIPRSHGFSLLELMVVLMIIGILVTFGVLSLNLGNQQGNVQDEVQRIRGVLEFAQEQAILKHEELALRFESSAYGFARLSRDKEGVAKWLDIKKDRQFQSHPLPDGMRLYVQVKDGSLALSDKKGATSAMVYVLSSGEITPFELRIEASDGSQYGLSSDFLGRMTSFDPRRGEGT